MLQVSIQPIMLGSAPGVGGDLAYPWLVTITAWVGDKSVEYHVGIHLQKFADHAWYVPKLRGQWYRRVTSRVDFGAGAGEV
jgi:hypothetical protein